MGFQSLKAPVPPSLLPGAGDSQGEAREPRSAGQGLGAEEGVEGLAQGLPAWREWGNAQSRSPWARGCTALASLCCHLPPGAVVWGATWCHLPASLQGLFWACLPGTWAVWARAAPLPSGGHSGLARSPEPCQEPRERPSLKLRESLGAGTLPGAPAQGCGREAAWGAGVLCRRNPVLLYFLCLLRGWRPGPGEAAVSSPWKEPLELPWASRGSLC